MTVPMAVVGLGSMGRQHIRVLSELEGAKIVVACDPDPAIRASVESRYRIPVVDHWGKVESYGPEAVVISAPTDLHFPIASHFLPLGIHCLVEKPIATSVMEGTELAEQAESYAVTLLVGHIERFNPIVDALKSLIVQGRIGQIVSIYVRRVGVSRPALPSVNVALDLALHDIDVCLYLLDRPGRLLLATGATIAPNVLEDHIDIVMRFGETVAVIQANWMTPVKIRRLAITGTRAFVEADYIHQDIKVYDTVPRRIQGRPWDFHSVSDVTSPADFPVVKQEPLRLELQHFLDCVSGRERPLVTPREAVRALDLAIAASNLANGRKL